MRESRKGFTLIELMGVIVVMSIILLVGLPTISNMMKKDVESTYERYLVELYAASESYFVENKDFYPALAAPGGQAYVTIDELMSEGYIRNVVTDPETNEDLPIETQVEVTVNADYTYSFQIKKGSNQSILVLLDANGGSVTPASLARTYKAKYGEIPTPTRSGYIFLGWFTEKTGGEQVSADQRITITRNHTLYAHWQAKTPTVSFDANGGSAVTKTMVVTVGKPYGELPTTTRKGYTFLGWYTAKSGGSLITRDTNVKNGDNHTLYAQWKQNKYIVTFNATGGSVNPTTKEVTQYSTYGELPTPTRSGYTFNGWFTATTGGTKITSTTEVTITANQTLYAQWTINQYTLTYNANGGSVSPTSKKVTVGATYGTLPTPTRSNHRFLGWYTAASGGTQVSSSTVMPASNVTIYAYWQATTTIVFNNDITGAQQKVTVDVGKTTTAPNMTASGYTRKSWSTTNSSLATVSGNTITAKAVGTVTIRSNWTLINPGVSTVYTVNNWSMNARTFTIKPSSASGVKYYTLDDTDTSCLYAGANQWPTGYLENYGGGNSSSRTQSKYICYKVCTGTNNYDGSNRCSVARAAWVGADTSSPSLGSWTQNSSTYLVTSTSAGCSSFGTHKINYTGSYAWRNVWESGKANYANYFMYCNQGATGKFTSVKWSNSCRTVQLQPSLSAWYQWWAKQQMVCVHTGKTYTWQQN